MSAKPAKDLYSFFKKKTPSNGLESDVLKETSAGRPTNDTQELPLTESGSSTSRVGSSFATATFPKLCKGKKPHYFQKNWLRLWTWLSYENGEMFCTICKDARPKDIFCKNSYFVGRGSVDFRTSALRRHASCKLHIQALKTMKSRNVNTLEKQVLKSLEEKEVGILSAFKTTYFMAKEHLANDLHRDLMDFLRFQKSHDAEQLAEGAYSHHKSQDDIRAAICYVIEEGIKEKLLESEFIGVIIDESTDISIAKTLIVYMTLVNCGKRETHYIRNVEIESGTADAVTAKLKEVCQDMGVDTGKIYGFGSDGASVMMGKRGGVASKLREQNPELVGIHCVAHRLALVTSQASRGVTFLEDYERKVAALFSYFHVSPARMQNLKEIQVLLAEDQLRMAGLHSVRWLSMKNAVTTLHRIYPSILLALEHDSDNATAKGLHSFFVKSSVLVLTAYLRDVLGSVAILSKVFQQDQLTVTSVKPMVQSTKSRIEAMEKSPAEFERATRHVIDRAFAESGSDEGTISVDYNGASVRFSAAMIHCVDEVKTAFTRNLIANLQNRFPSDDMSVANSFSALDPGNIGKLRSDGVQLEIYGVPEMKVLAEFYAPSLPDAESCVNEEYPLFKQVVVNNYLNFSLAEMAEKIITDLSTEFPNLIVLYKLLLILPVSSAACERGFSMQNLIKSSRRNRLSTESVNALTLISLEGPHFRAFQYDKAVARWKCDKSRRSVTGMQY